MQELNRDDLVNGAFSTAYGGLFGAALLGRASGGLVVHTALGGVLGACAGVITALACKKLLGGIDNSVCLPVLMTGSIAAAAKMGFIPLKQAILLSLGTATSALVRAHQTWAMWHPKWAQPSFHTPIHWPSHPSALAFLIASAEKSPAGGEA